MEKIRMTEAERASLQAKLDECLARREIIKKEISTARGFGDLSENSEYDEAKNEQAKVEAEIADLTVMLQNAEIIDESTMDIRSISLGSVVKLYDEDFEEEITYSIVGSNQADPLEQKISDQSPIGAALVGKRAGDSAEAELPNGNVAHFEIREVRR